MLSLWKYVLKNVINQHTVVLFQRTDIYPKKIFRSKAFSLKALFADFFSVKLIFLIGFISVQMLFKNNK